MYHCRTLLSISSILEAFPIVEPHWCKRTKQMPDKCNCGKWIHLAKGDKDRQYFFTCDVHHYSNYEAACRQLQGKPLHSFHGHVEELTTIIYHIRGTSTTLETHIGLKMNEETKGNMFIININKLSLKKANTAI